MKTIKHRNRKSKVNVAVVGLGVMGAAHIKAYEQIPEARIVAVCAHSRVPVNGVLADISGTPSGRGGIRLDKNVRVYRQLEEVLADPDVDLVDLCLPTPLHVPQSIAALRAGKHVMCEKPLARNSKLAGEILKAQRSAKGFFMPAMCMRFWPGWSLLKDLSETGVYGKILAARFRRVSGPPKWSRDRYFKGKESGGALLDLHIHDTDFVQFLFGRPTSVFSTGQSRFSGAIDHVVTQYRVAGGATVYAEGSWMMTEGFSMTYTVIFERATLDFDNARGKDALRLDEEGKPSRIVKCKGTNGYVGELRHMIESILSNQPPTIVTAQDGLSAVEICEAEEKSVKTKKEIFLPKKSSRF